MYAFGAMLDEPYDLSLAELLQSSTAWGPDRAATAPTHVAFSFFDGPESVRTVDAASPLTFAFGIDYGSAQQYLVAPMMENGWAVLGEAEKFISVSRQRMSSVIERGKTVEITLVGAPHEQVTLWALPPTKRVPTKFSTIVGPDGIGTLTLTAAP
jgi:hypothetical protein